VTAYFRQLPAPPATLAEAYKNCNCLSASGSIQSTGTGVAAGVHESLVADLKAMGIVTKTETQQIQQGTALASQARADNVNGMSRSQQTSMSGTQATQLTAALTTLLSTPWQGSAADAQQRLKAMNTAYSNLQAFYEQTDNAYGIAITAANYGYSGDATQDQALTQLSSGQYTVLNQVGQLEGFLNRIYQFGATQQALLLKGGK
jgi:hypothetical protein